ncbi:sigma-70 family RNA polymerase sigma factor [Pseudoflavonifractor sp. AF19-9AC]|nr:sigma-70 family RNA polymerase sigma factor [Pseudoflavonifractor sp. AF19-9AC]
MEKSEVMALVPRCLAGDEEAREALVLAVQNRVFYHCKKMLKNEDDALDATQEILITMLTKLDTLKEPAAFGGWLSAMTANYCRNVLRRSGREIPIPEDEEGNSMLDTIEAPDEQEVPDKALDSAESRRMIVELIDALPEAQRLCVLMYYYDEMGVKAIAEALGTSEGTVKSRLNYARKAIKEGVERYAAQGVKLYGLAPLPFLVYILKQDALLGGLTAAQSSACAQAALAGSSAALAGAAGGAAAGAGTTAAVGTTTAAGTAGGAGAAVSGAAAGGTAASAGTGNALTAMLLAHKGIAAAVAGVVLTGAIGGTVLLSQPKQPAEEPQPPAIEVVGPLPEPEPEPEPPQRTGIVNSELATIMWPGYSMDVPSMYDAATMEEIPYKEIVWSSENPDLVQIENYKIIPQDKEGTAFINASWNGYTSRCRIEIVERSDTISLDAKLIIHTLGNDFRLRLYDYTVSPFGDGYTVDWAVSDSNILSIEPQMTADGEYAVRVYLKEVGSAFVSCTVTWPDGTTRSACCNVVVRPAR